jgi:hypothetical protein
MAWPPEAIAARDTVDVTPLREAFEASGLTAYEVADRLGWRSTHVRYGRVVNRPDPSRVNRALGRKPYNLGRGYGHRHRQAVRYETALQLASALGVDPFEIGL